MLLCVIVTCVVVSDGDVVVCVFGAWCSLCVALVCVMFVSCVCVCCGVCVCLVLCCL